MKPGHTIFWKRGNGTFVEGTVGLAVGSDPNRKDRAVEMSHLIEHNALGRIDAFDVENGEIVKKYEMDYMKQNSKVYER